MARPIVLLAALLSSACALPPPRQSAFTPAPCAFRAPEQATVRCGWLTVPENRKNSGTRDIRLHVAIYASRSATPQPDPILWLAGGPGGRAHFLSSHLFDRVVAPYLWNREFIVMDVRGTGYSEPALNCPQRDGRSGSWVVPCRERLATIADLSAYNSAAVAADLADFRAALGLKAWNLFGESYGTRLALTAARDAPEGIRSIVLDSVVPPEADQYADEPSKFDGAIAALARACTGACAAAFPDIRAAIVEAADWLDLHPRQVQGEYLGARYDIRLDGRSFLQGVRMALYESDLIPRLPMAIYGVRSSQDDSFWHRVFGIEAQISSNLVDFGAHLSYHCSEEVPFTNWQRMRDESRRHPWMRGVLNGAHMADACRTWRAGVGDPRENLPVESSIPVLLLSGDCDPVTPPAYAASAAVRLPRSYNIVFRGMGHWLTANPVNTCAQQMVRDFLDNPASRPQTDCAAGYRPAWQLP